MEQERDSRRISRSDIVCLEGNGARPSHKGIGWHVGDIMYTLNSTEVHCVCYGISPYCSNSMMSSNPHSGIYEADTSRTLDLNGGNPACNQGGMIVVEVHSVGAPSARFENNDAQRGHLSDIESANGDGGEQRAPNTGDR